MYIDVTGFSNEGRCCSKKNQKLKTKHRVPVKRGVGPGSGVYIFVFKRMLF